MAAPDLLVQHGVAVLFAWAFAVQAGVPAPAVPMLVGAGALSGSGRMDLALAVAAATAAALGADVLWYSLGRVPWHPSARDPVPVLPGPGLISSGTPRSGSPPIGCAI